MNTRAAVDAVTFRVRACVRVRACARACACARVRVRVRARPRVCACVRVRVRVRASFFSNSLIRALSNCGSPLA